MKRMHPVILILTLHCILASGCARPSQPPSETSTSSLPAATAVRRDWRKELDSISIPIVTYHHVTNVPNKREIYTVATADFHSHMRYLRDHHFHPISLAELTAFLEEGKALPAKPVVIAFDDGYQSTLTVAAPILKQLGLNKATLFVYTSFVDSGYKGTIRWKELQRLEREYGFDVQCHTFTHPYTIWKDRDKKTGRLESDAAYVKRIYETQLLYPRKRIEQMLHHPVTHLAWPFGLYNERVMDLAKKAGMQYLYTINPGPNDIYSRPDALRRQLLVYGMGVRDFAAIVNQRSLVATGLSPSDGAMLRGSPAHISLKLLRPESLDTASLRAQVDGESVAVQWNPGAGTLAFASKKPLIKRDRFHEVQVWGMARDGQQVHKLGWAFYIS